MGRLVQTVGGGGGECLPCSVVAGVGLFLGSLEHVLKSLTAAEHWLPLSHCFTCGGLGYHILWLCQDSLCGFANRFI